VSDVTASKPFCSIPIRKDLLMPERVERMAKEMQAYYLDRARAMQTRVAEQPHELQELIGRIA
jgi:hypothetical protein